MTVDEINRGLFEVVLPNFFPGKPHSWEEVGQSILVWVTGEKAQTVKIFNPVKDSNHLREYVYPELIRRKLWLRFINKVEAAWAAAPDDVDSIGTFNRYLLCCDPAVLAAAALKVLGGGE